MNIWKTLYIIQLLRCQASKQTPSQHHIRWVKQKLSLEFAHSMCCTANMGNLHMRMKQRVKLIHMSEDIKVVATNRKANFEYFLLEKFEAGISLQGSEIKSIRAGQVSIQEAYVDIQDGKQAWLVEAHIAPYEQANQFNHEPRRKRRLLLHKKQIRQLWNNVRTKGMTIVPTRVYLKNGRAKVEIALAKGKKAYDKRAGIAKRDAERSAEREMRVR